MFQAGEGRLQHYSMLLDETQERLIIGGKDILYSLNLERVTAPHKEVHAFIAVLRIWATCLSGIVICVCVCVCVHVWYSLSSHLAHDSTLRKAICVFC